MNEKLQSVVKMYVMTMNSDITFAAVLHNKHPFNHQPIQSLTHSITSLFTVLNIIVCTIIRIHVLQCGSFSWLKRL